MSEALTHKVAKSLNWDLTPGTMGPCESCATWKSPSKNLPKNHDSSNTIKDSGRVHLDITSIKQKKGQPRTMKPHWQIIIDEHTQMKVSYFYPMKNSMVEPTCELYHHWNQMGCPVKILRMDNAGENKLLDKQIHSKDWKLDIQVEYIARATLQQNSLAEVGFATVVNHGRAMMA
jgi:hypothetical protein